MNAVRQSGGGWATKIPLIADANGLLLAMHRAPGQTVNAAAAEDVLAPVDARPKQLLADKGYHGDDPGFGLHSDGTRPVIPWTSNRRARRYLDREAYHLRNRIERTFGFPKHFRRLAARYNRTAVGGGG
ncbi:MAG: transposase [Pseudomonadota bacterium]